MSKFQDYYPDAERLYVREGKTQREISELLGISEKTISKWSSSGQWLKQRKEYLVSTKSGPVQILEGRLRTLLEDPAIDARKTDEMYKIQLLIDRMRGGFDIKGATIEIMDRFVKYINRAETDKVFVGKLAEHIHKFFEETRRE